MKFYFVLFLMLFVFLAIPTSHAELVNLTMSPNQPYTTDNLDCFWKVSGSYDSYMVNVSWKKNNVTQDLYNNTIICLNNTLCSSGKPVNASITIKHEFWNCSVLAYNGTESFESSVVREIKNSPPDFGSYTTVFNINESQLTYIKSYATTDYDGDSVYYSVTGINKTKNYRCYGGATSTGSASAAISSSGNLQISGTPTRTVVGEYSIFIFSWELDGGATLAFINFSINCTYVPITLTSISNQLVQFNKSFSLSTSTGGDAVNRSFSDNTTFFEINITTGAISFTMTDENFVGVHRVNISVNDGADLYDPGNYTAWQIVNFTTVMSPIINETNVTNTTGYFVYNELIRRAYIFQNSTIVFTQISYDPPNNPGSHNLTYSWKLGATQKSTSSSWTYTPQSSEVGNYSVTLTISNEYAFTATASWNITINKSYIPPVFLPNLRPKLEINYSGSDQLLVIQPAGEDTFITSSNTSGNYASNKTLNVGNNRKALLKFDLSSIPNGATINNAELKLYLYDVTSNSSSNISVYRITSDWSADFTTWVNRTSNGTWIVNGSDYSNITISNNSVESKYDWYVWDVTSLIQDWYNSVYPNYGLVLASPSSIEKKFASNEIRSPIPEQRWSMNTIYYSDIMLNTYFLELDGNPLYYRWDEPQYINITVDDYTRAIFNPDPSFFGTTYTKFYTTNDAGMEAESNTVTLVVEEDEMEIRYVPRTMPVERTRMEEVQKIASLSILITSIITVDPTQNITLPVKLANTGQLALSDIDISINTTDLTNSGIQIKLKDSHIDNLLVGEQYDTEVFINTKNAQSQRYNVTIMALVGSPSFYQSTKFYVDIMELPESLQKKLRLVQDLFQENPECMELRAVLDSIDESVNRGDYGRAEDLINAAIKNCKALVNYSPVERRGENLDLIRNIALVIFASVMFIYAGFRIFSYKRGRNYKKITVG